MVTVKQAQGESLLILGLVQWIKLCNQESAFQSSCGFFGIDCSTGGGGGYYSTKFYTGRFRPEV